MTETNQILGVIGGSGLYAMKEFELEEELQVKTPYGSPSDKFFKGKLSGKPIIFLPRHGIGHRINPSELNFRANIWAFKSLGVKSILSVSAVGSLKEEIKPGHMVIVDQFFDRTKSRASTFYEDGIVAHISFADPLCASLRKNLIQACQNLSIEYHQDGTYLCMEGPMFSTKAESRFYRQIGASVIGMTNLQEAKLAREAEICYATLALSTDYDCWHEAHDTVTTEQIVETLHQNVSKAQDILGSLIKKYEFKSDCSCQSSVKNAIMTAPDKISESAKEKLGLIINKYL